MDGSKVICKLDIKVGNEEIVARSKYCKPSHPVAYSIYEEMIAVLQTTAKPLALYKKVGIEKISGMQVILEGGFVLSSSLLSQLTASANFLVVILCTLGKDIDEKIAEYYQGGFYAKVYFLDAVASVMTSLLGEKLTKSISLELSAEGLKTTIPLGPGNSYWDNLLDQSVIYNILEPSSFGVSIMENGVLLPKKSITSVMGVGYTLPKSAESECFYCDIKFQCSLSRVKKC